jgi:carbonic anhydrase
MTEKMHTGLPVKGFTPVPDSAVQLANINKEMEESVLRQLDKLKADPSVDQRWLAVGRTHIEQGFMAANRALFKPGRVQLPGDAQLL